MKVTIEDVGPCRKVMHIQASAEDVRSDYDSIVDAFAKMAKVGGFRPGKAPREIVERQYLKPISDETKDRVLPRLYKEALDEHALSPVAAIDVSDVDFEKTKGMEFRVTIDVPPEFKLPKYKKVTLKAQPVEVKDEQVEETVKQLLESRARFDDVLERPVKAGDLVQVDYTGLCDGAPVKELASDAPGLGEGKDFWMLLEDPEYLPGFNTALPGLAVNESKEISVDFPADYHVASLAGKQAAYTASVKAIREKVLPEIDEAFLKQFEVETEADLRKKIQDDLLSMGERNEQDRLKDELAKVLLEKAKFDLPQSSVAEETNLTVQSIIRRISRQGASREDIEKQRDEILDLANKTSTDRVKLTFLLNKIADAEEITVEESDVEERLKTLSAQYQMPEEKLKAEMQKNDAMGRLETEIRSEKTMAFLLEHAKIKK